MSRQIWVARMVDGEFRLIPVGEVEHTPRVHVIQDSMEPTWHPATGETIDSKSAFRRLTKASGCEEVGNEPLRLERPQFEPGSGLKEALLGAWEKHERR